MESSQLWKGVWDRYSNVSEEKRAKIQKAVWWMLGTIFVLQLYFVRELLAAEMIFGLGFAVILFICGIIYMIGVLGEQGLAWSESYVRVVARSARRGVGFVEEISRRPFRHPRSESAR